MYGTRTRRSVWFNMKLSCATLGFANDAPLEVSLGRISKAGFKAVDIFAWRPHLHPTDYTKEMRKKVKEMAAELGMKVSGLSVQGGRFGMQFNFCYPWKVARDDVVSYYKDCIEVASDLGAEAINVLTGHVLYGTTPEQAWQWTKECILELVELAEERDVTLGLHPHSLWESNPGGLVTTDDVLRMIREVGSKKVRFMLDLGSQHCTEPNLSDVVRKGIKYLCYVHVGDNDGLHGPEHRPPGQGTINWETFLKTLKDEGYAGYLALQPFSNAPIDVDAWISESKAYMEQVMTKLAIPVQ